MIKVYIKYFWYILTHKWAVARECLKYGLYSRSITHDLTKFLPDEFFPYAHYWFKDCENPKYLEAFEDAAVVHCTRNRHHWDFWQGREMDQKSELEMFCDWIAMGKTVGKEIPVSEWYDATKSKRKLHPNTQKRIEKLVYEN